MSHIHEVYDSDNNFIIDGVTRVIKNASTSKTTVMQFDHNSEVFTFELPRYIEGHDMMNCNRVEVHYLNIDTSTKQEKEGIYLVNDLQVKVDDDTKLTCSWLISQNATGLVGSLNFLLRFICLTDDVIDYVWNTSIHSGIYVSKGIYNSDIVAEQYIDTIKAWENRLEVVENSIGSSGISPIIKVTENAEGNKVEITDAEGTKVFYIKNGVDGEKGDKGDKGEQGIQGIQGVQGEQGVSGVYVGTGDMPSGYNVQIDPNGTTVEYATKTELDKRVELKTGYHNEIDTYFKQGLYLIKYGGNKPIMNFHPYYLLVTHKFGDVQFRLSPSDHGHPVQYLFDGNTIRTREVIEGYAIGIDPEWSEWVEYATKIVQTTDEQEHPVYGTELLNSTDWVLGTGWSGDLESGFTHTAGNTEPLTFTMSNTGTKLFRVCFNSSVPFTPTNILVSLGNSEAVQFFGQVTPIVFGIQSVSDGNLIFTPESTYSGTITVTSIKEVTSPSECVNEVIDSSNEISTEYRYSSGNRNSLFIGKNSGQYNDGGIGNVGVGSYTLSKNLSGFWNVGIGYMSLKNNTAGSRNIGIGYIALNDNTSGHRNVAIGTFALNQNTSGSWNIAIGADCMDHNTTGKNNTSVGFQAMYLNETGYQNSAFGATSLKAITTGYNNVGIGFNAGAGIKTGSENLAIGRGALTYCEGGSYNTAVGANALYGCKNGNLNVAIGYLAGKGTSGSAFKENIFIGSSTGQKIGDGANRNVIIGYSSGNTLTTGNYNIIIGSTCEVPNATNNYQLNIGNLITGNMATGSKSVTINGTMTINNLPTSDPNVAGQLWNDNGTVKVSVG